MKNKEHSGDDHTDEARVGEATDQAADAPLFPALERLNGRQRRFVIAYCGTARMNASVAARIAGYATTNRSDRSAGYQAKKNPSVQAAIKEMLDVASGGVDEAVYRLNSRARSSIDNVLTISDDGVVSVDLRKARETDEIHNIKSIRHTKHGVSIEMYDAQAADFRLLNHFRNTRLDDMDAREAEVLDREAALDEEEAANAAGTGGRKMEVNIRYFNPAGRKITEGGRIISDDDA